VTAVVREEVVGDQAERTVYLLHGILGSGRNWRSFARRWVQRRPELRVLLVDQRHHGDAPPSHGPDTLEACAADVEALEARHGAADVVVGHSFGGKVALAWAAHGGGATWVLDSPPGAPTTVPTAADNDVLHIVHTLTTAPVPAADRSVIRAHLAHAGIPAPIVAWLLTSAQRGPDGWRFVWDLDGVQRLMRDYFTTDLWDAAIANHAHLVHAGRSDRWHPDELARGREAAAQGTIGWHELPNAGHWLHVDDPDGLIALLDAL
jgi:pimeloyl-ACP methyl ester carboxylesterase